MAKSGPAIARRTIFKLYNMTKAHKFMILGLVLVILAFLDATLYYFAEHAAGYSPSVYDALRAKLPLWGTGLILLPFIFITAGTFVRELHNLKSAIPKAIFWLALIAFFRVLLGSFYYQFTAAGMPSVEQALAQFSKHLALFYFSSIASTVLLFAACIFIAGEKKERWNGALDSDSETIADFSIDSWEAVKDAAWQTADRVLIKSKDRSVFVKVNEIEWIESAGNYVTIHTTDREYLLRKSMQQMETILDGKTFFRAHRTTIVNLGKIKELRQLEGEQYVVCLYNGKELKISRAKIEKLESLLSIESRS